MPPEKPSRNFYEILPTVGRVEQELSQLDLTTLQSIYEIAELVEQTLTAITAWGKGVGDDEELADIPITAIENAERGVILLLERLLRKQNIRELLGRNPAIKRTFAFSECEGNVPLIETRMRWFKGRIAQVIKRQYGLIRVAA